MSKASFLWNPSATYFVRYTIFHKDGSSESHQTASYGSDGIDACLNLKQRLISHSVYDKYLFEIIEQKTYGK